MRGGAAVTMASDICTLYTNKMCPFAQKAWIALEEKKATQVNVHIYTRAHLYISDNLSWRRCT